MNQDRYPGVYTAMGDMELRRHERPPMGGMEMRRYDNMPMNDMGMMRRNNMPMGEMGMMRHDNMPMNDMGMMRHDNMPMNGMGMMHHDNMPYCIDHETELMDVQLAHAYVPFQKFCPTFMPMTALKKGTAFPGLVGVYGWEPKQEMGGEYL